MIFGEKQIFALNCVLDPFDSDRVGISMHIACKEFGDVEETCPAGVIAHSASIFLEYSGSRGPLQMESADVFSYLVDVMYGDEWREAMNGQYHERFAVHEVADVSVGDKGWVFFLIDGDSSDSRLLVGNRDSGYISCHTIAKGYVEHVLQEYLNWIKHREQSSS